MHTGASSTTKVVRLQKAHDLTVETVPLPAPGPGQVLVRMAAGGICGSDLHYYHEGGFGLVRVREPIILGHEVSGHVEALGPGVEGLRAGMLVAVNPSLPCNTCRFCLAGQPQHCLDMHFLGSAMRTPHEQGGFRERMVTDARRCVPLGDKVSPAEAACTEPLSVCLHALNQAPPVVGKRVIVSGAGPIGALMVAVLRHAGAREIVATDVQDAALKTAAAMGATHTVNVATNAPALDPEKEERGKFDVAFECSGNAAAIALDLAVLRPRGTLVQVGIASEATLPLSQLVSKEIVLRGSQRFHPEFEWAAELIGGRRIDVRPIITATYAIDDAVAAFDLASDRSKACKVQLALSPA